MIFLARLFGYIMILLAGMTTVVWLQFELIFPVPETKNRGDFHPLYSLPAWTYVTVFSLFVTLAVIFTLIGRWDQNKSL